MEALMPHFQSGKLLHFATDVLVLTRFASNYLKFAAGIFLEHAATIVPCNTCAVVATELYCANIRHNIIYVGIMSSGIVVSSIATLETLTKFLDFHVRKMWLTRAFQNSARANRPNYLHFRISRAMKCKT